MIFFEFFHPRAGRSGHLGQPSPLRPAAFRIAGMAHALFGASPLCRRTHAHKAGLDDEMMKYDGDEIFWKSDAGGCGLHGYFAASLRNGDECI